MKVNIKAVTHSIILTVQRKSLNFLQYDYPTFHKEFRLAQNRMMKSKRQFPIDVCHVFPETNHGVTFESKVRENKFKNLVFSIINDHRTEKRKPSLSSVL